MNYIKTGANLSLLETSNFNNVLDGTILTVQLAMEKIDSILLPATISEDGLLSYQDKIIIDNIDTDANNYTHPTGDGNEHVPANGITNEGNVLISTATEGVYEWGVISLNKIEEISLLTPQNGDSLIFNNITNKWENIKLEVLPSQLNNSGKILTTDGTIASWELPADGLPSQLNNSGKILTTDGTDATWELPADGLPSQLNNSGLYLKTDGTNAIWTDVVDDMYIMQNTEFIATNNQDTFLINYVPGRIDVLRNGIQLVLSDYTAGNGTSVVLGVPADIDDNIVIRTYNIVSVLDNYSVNETNSLLDTKVDYIGNKDIEITDFNKGVILHSPNGTKFRITVTDNGNLVSTEVI